MKVVIRKYELSISGFNTFKFPIEYEILTVQSVKEQLFMWVMFDTNDVMNQYVEIEVFPSETDIIDVKRKYITTVQTFDGVFIWHIFQRIRNSEYE